MATGIDERKRGDGKTAFQAHVFDKRTGRRIRKTFDNKTAAKQWRNDAMTALRAGTMTTSRGPTLNDAVDKWLDALREGHVRNRSGDPYKPSAIRGYEHCLRHRVLPQIGHMRLEEIRPQDVQRLVDRLVENKCAAATIDSALTPLRALYRRAVARGEVTSNPTLRIEKPAVRCKVRIVASPVEAATRLDALDREDQPLWATAFYAGLRRGELIGLRWEDVDLATGVLHVRRGWDAVEGEIAPKSRQGRRAVPIPAVLRDYLLEHRMATMGDGRVFSAARQVRSQAERAGKRWADQGHKRLTLHDARHTYASLMIAAGVNAKALSTFMGHANIGITLDLYGHMMPGSEEEAATLLDAYLAREVDGSNCHANCRAHRQRRGVEPNSGDVLHLSGPVRDPRPRPGARRSGAVGTHPGMTFADENQDDAVPPPSPRRSRPPARRSRRRGCRSPRPSAASGRTGPGPIPS